MCVELLRCSAVGVGLSPCVCIVLYSQQLVGVLMVLKEGGLLLACNGFSIVPLLLMVLKEVDFFVCHWYDLVSMINESVYVV